MQIIALTATFTAEPLQEPLSFWMNELDIPCLVKFGPYNQVFQQLLEGGLRIPALVALLAWNG